MQQYNKLSLPVLAASFTLMIGAATITPSAQADTVQIPIGSQSQALQDQARPKNGESQNGVQNTYGQPTAVKGPVGEPPITRWDYPNFSVYFEFDRVLHTVLRHSEPKSNTQ